MLRDKGGYPDSYIPPKSRPLLEQVDLAFRIVAARNALPSMTWDQLAVVEGVPKRTLQHFYKSWLDGVGAPTKRRSSGHSLARRIGRAPATHGTRVASGKT
jgi:hypothetical protein